MPRRILPAIDDAAVQVAIRRHLAALAGASYLRTIRINVYHPCRERIPIHDTAIGDRFQ